MAISVIIYWITTGLISAGMCFAALQYLTNAKMKSEFARLGYPNYFRIELAIAKLLGAVVLIVPRLPLLLKEWAYAGFAITFVSAIIAHAANKDAAPKLAAPLIALLILAVSFLEFHQMI